MTAYEDNGTDLHQDADALQAMFTQQLMIDARETFREMKSPAVLRIRADMAEPVSYRMLSMRLANMGSARESLRERLMKIIDAQIPLEQQAQRDSLLRDVQRAIDTCRRVLESTDDESIVSKVVENAEMMSHHIGKMSALLTVRFPDFSMQLAKASLQATKTAENAPQIAAEMKAAYDAVRAEIDAAGPRAPMPVSVIAIEAEGEPEEVLTVR